MSEDQKLQQWMENAKYLPEVIRDFHDAKDLFKAMHEIINQNDTANDIGWVNGQIYTIDVFLWFMARRGYTLQRSRAKLPFRNLEEDIKVANDHRVKCMDEAMKGMFAPSSKPEGDESASE